MKPVQGVSIAVVAFVSIDFVVKRAYASAPIPTTVTAPAVANRRSCKACPGLESRIFRHR